MTCLDIKLSGAMTNAGNLPFAEVDSILSSGSLFLFEPAHGSNPQIGTALPEIPFASGGGYDTNVVQFPNIAARPASLLLSLTPFDATLSIANGTATVTVVSGGAINEGDEIWNASLTIQIGTIAAFGSGTGNTGTYQITPAQTLASTAVKIKPGMKPIIRRKGDMKASGDVEVDFKTEWTPKGGIHIASSRTTMRAASMSIHTMLPGAQKRYMFVNPSHEYYHSVWYKMTADLLVGYTAPYIFLAKNSGAGSFFFSSSRASNGAMNNFSMPVGTRNTVGMIVEQMSNNFDGTALSNEGADFLPFLFQIGGSVGAFGPTYGRNNSMSAVIYREYIEDLTASGRTFAQVKALDDAAYTVAFGAGGRFNGDTNTAPGTLIA